MPATIPFDASSSNSLPIEPGSMTEFAADPIAMMRTLHEKHGEIVALQEESQKVYFVFGQEYNQQVLSNAADFHSRFFAIRGSKKSPQRRLTAGLLSMNGEAHKQHRRMVKSPFSRRAISSYCESIADFCDDLLTCWQPGDTIDLNAEMTRYMLHVTSSILFGLDVPELAFEIGEMTEKWVDYSHRLGPLAFASHPELRAEYDAMMEFAGRLEEKMLELIQRRRSSDRQGQDVLSLLLNAYDEEGGISDTQLVGHATLLFAAAHLTTAHTMTWTHFLLSQHPDTMHELHDELDTVLHGQTPELEHLDRLPVMERVIKESMRVLPASSYSQRMTANSVQLGPFQLPPGSLVIFSQFMTHHLERLYPKPDRFDPSRWTKISPSPYAYLPFGAGPRMCLGGPLAMQILKISLPMMLQRYRLALVPGTSVNAQVISTMLNPTSSIQMKVYDQDGCFSASTVNGSIRSLVELPYSSSTELPESVAA